MQVYHAQNSKNFPKYENFIKKNYQLEIGKHSASVKRNRSADTLKHIFSRLFHLFRLTDRNHVENKINSKYKNNLDQLVAFFTRHNIEERKDSKGNITYDLSTLNETVGVELYNDTLVEPKIEVCSDHGFLRNKKTGWPLLMVGAFYYNEEHKSYMPCFGGGRCHDVNLAFNELAKLFASLNGNKYLPNGTVTKEEDLGISNNFEHYCYKNNSLGEDMEIDLSSESTGYGTLYNMKVLGVDLKNKFYSLEKGVLGGLPLFSFNGNLAYKDDKSEGVTEKTINEKINHDIAVFHDSCLYIDLGNFLKQETSHKVSDGKKKASKTLSPEKLDYLAKLFNVDKALNKMNNLSEMSSNQT